MGIIIRESIKTSIISYIGVVIGTINVLFIYNKFLTAEEFGFYSAILSFAVVYSGFTNLGIPHICVRFFNRFSNEKEKYQGFFTVLLLLPLFGFAAFFALFYGFRDLFGFLYEESPMLVEYAWALPILTFFVLYQSVLEAYCRAHLKVVIPVTIRELFLKLSNSFLVVSYYFDWLSFYQMIVGLVIAYGLSVLFLALYIIYLRRFYLVWRLDVFKSPYFPDMVRYGLLTMVGGAAATTLPHLEKVLLPMYENGLANTAIFTIAMSIGIVISIPKNTIASISEPILAKAWADDNREEVQNIYSKSALNLCIIGLFLFAGVWSSIDSIFEIIPNPDRYREGKYVVLLLCLSSWFDMATGLNSEILKNSRYYSTELGFFIVRLLVLLGANLLFIPMFGVLGAAIAILSSTVLYNLVKMGFIYAKFRFFPFGKNFVKVLVLGAITFLLTHLIDWYAGSGFWENILEIIVKSIVVTLVFGGGVLLLKVSEDLNTTVSTVFKRIRAMIKVG